MKKTLKTILLFVNIVLCIFVLLLVRIIFIAAGPRRARIASRVVQLSSRLMAATLSVKINLVGHTEYLKESGLFFVSNHLSYIDGVVISSIWPLVFIGRSDMKYWPLFGALTYLSDTIFVNRMNYSNIKVELARIVSILSAGANVILFPEGTSGDGKQLGVFKTSFFEAPLKAGCRIVPLAVRYCKVNGKPVTDENKDLVYWYGDMYFFPHLMGVLGLNDIEIEVKIFNPLEVTGQRKEAGAVCQEMINNHLNHHEAKI
jgi:1-acyl-sn-glycerol-3-phosphate acyltransferase